MAKTEKPKVPRAVKVFSPNKTFNGESAGVQFRNGEGSTQIPWVLQWFREHGYTIEGEADTADQNEDPPAGENGQDEKEE